MNTVMDIIVGLLMIGIGVIILVFPKASWKFRMEMRYMFRKWEEREPSPPEVIMEGLLGGFLAVIGLLLCVMQP